MKQALLVGCGKIGFRHLVACCKSEQFQKISVVEPNAGRIDECFSSAELAVPNRPELLGFSDLKSARLALNGPVELLISAVSADAQRVTFENLGALAPRYVLLEKPLGQSRAAIESMVQDPVVKSRTESIFVNFSRNTWSGYELIKTRFTQRKSGEQFHVEVSGNLWGLGCNSVHFLELFRWMTDDSALQFGSGAVTPSPLGNKRGPQFEEFVGSLTFKNGRGDSLQLTASFADEKVEAIQMLVTEKTSRSLLFCASEEKDEILDCPTLVRGSLGSRFVTQTTEEFARALGTDRVGLPDLVTAVISHRVFFEALEAILGRKEFRIT